MVRIQDDLSEQVPGELPAGATAASAGGNYVVVDIGNGHYAFYAHLKPDTLTVAEGDEVTKGQVLGLLGNTGNGDGPHLHFHVMDGPGPLTSNGLPYQFESFEVQGTLTNTADLQTGVEAEIDRNPHRVVRGTTPAQQPAHHVPRVRRLAAAPALPNAQPMGVEGTEPSRKHHRSLRPDHWTRLSWSMRVGGGT